MVSGVVGCVVDSSVCCGGFSIYVDFQFGVVPDYCEVKVVNLVVVLMGWI